MRYKFHLFLLFFVTILSFQTISAQSPSNRLLVDLKQVAVSIQISSELEQYGLTKRQLEEDAELRLRRVGIFSNTKTPNTLIVHIQNVGFDDSGIAYSVEVSLNQAVALERRKTERFFAGTWTVKTIGVGSKSNINAIREIVLKIIDKFVSDYKIANNLSAKSICADIIDDILGECEPAATSAKEKSNDSPFTARYVGGNRPPELEIFNDSDRTLYLDLGKDKLTPYVIPSKTSRKITLTDGSYKFKANAARVAPLEGQELFEVGYVYGWRFTVITKRVR